MLVVDDNATNRRMLALQTAKWGMVADTESPEEALRWVQAGRALRPGDPRHAHAGMDGAQLAAPHPRGRPHAAAGAVQLAGPQARRAAPRACSPPRWPSRCARASCSTRWSRCWRTTTAPRRAPRRRQAAHRRRHGRRHPLRILLAEDNVVNQKLALRLLQQMGYRADVAANGIEAIESVERQPYDVVLMDVQMPEMDGLEATRRIVRAGPTGERPRIVAMTANAMQGDREECLAAGMDDYVTKPIRVEALVEALAWRWRCCEREPFDLMLLDIEMPEMDGFQVLERLLADRRCATCR
jgi:CheY-like chemotaxis protein